MSIDLEKLAIYRIIHIDNLEHDLQHGLYCKKMCISNPLYKNIGSTEIISQRDIARVKCYPKSVVNDYVPFYFSYRTPMLYNIKTGHGVPKISQQDIVYLCCKMIDLTTDKFQWCYTDGNAAKKITKFFTDLDGIDTNIDWRSISTTDFRDNNADGDEDRLRKKHAEFLVKLHVPTDFIKSIVVYNQEKKETVETIIDRLGMKINVLVNPGNKYYF